MHSKKGISAGRASRCVPESLERRVLMAAGTPVTLQFEGVASLGGVVVANANAGYTGRGYVDYVDNNGLVTMPINGVPETGLYEIAFRYANGSSSARPLSIESEQQLINPRLSFAPTGSWSKWGTVKVQAQLRAGDNYLSIGALGQNGPNLDALTYTRVDTPLPEGTTLQAENFRPGGGHVATNHPGYTGDGFVDFDLDSGAFLTVDLPPKPAGTYAFDIRYANGSTSTRTMRVATDNQDFVNLAFPPTGGWAVWKTVRVNFPFIDSNANSLTFATTGTNGPNIDAITFRKVDDTPPPTEFSRTIQAETGTGFNAGPASDGTGYTGSGFVRFGDGGQFTIPTGALPAEGDYVLEFRYAGGGPMGLSSGTGLRGGMRAVFDPTGSESTWKTYRVEAHLPAAGDSITLGTMGYGTPLIDSMTVRRLGDDEKLVLKTQVENALWQGATIGDGLGAERGYVDYQSDSRGSISWEVPAARPRTATLTIRYASGATSNRPLELRQNGEVLGTLPFAPTGSWSTWKTVTRTVTLAQGINRFQLKTIGSNGPNVDWVSVESVD